MVTQAAIWEWGASGAKRCYESSIGWLKLTSSEILVGLKDDSHECNPTCWSQEVDEIHSFEQRQVVCTAMDNDNTR